MLIHTQRHNYCFSGMNTKYVFGKIKQKRIAHLSARKKAYGLNFKYFSEILQLYCNSNLNE